MPATAEAPARRVAADDAPPSAGPPHPPPALSIIDNCGAYTSHCGYCNAPGETAASVGMWAHALAPGTYNALVDAGWRRSGRWVYRPLPTAALETVVGEEQPSTSTSTTTTHPCCVAHTIRLDVGQFAPSRAQRRCAARVAAFLAGGVLPPPAAGGGRGGHPPSANGGGSAAEPPSTVTSAWASAVSGEQAASSPALVLPLPRSLRGSGGGDDRPPSPRGVSPVVAAGLRAAAAGPFAWPPTSGGGGGPAPPPPPAGVGAGQPPTGPVDAAALAARLLRDAVPAASRGPPPPPQQQQQQQQQQPDRKRKAGTPALPDRPQSAGRAGVGTAARAAAEAALVGAVCGLALATPPSLPPLPPLAPPKAAVARRLPPTLALTCPAGFVLAAAARKRGAGEGDADSTDPPATPPALAAALAAALNAGGGLPAGWLAAGEGGHLNLHAPDAAAAAAEREAAGGGGGGCTPGSPPPSPPAAAAAAAGVAKAATTADAGTAQPLRAVRSRRSWPSLADAAATSGGEGVGGDAPVAQQQQQERPPVPPPAGTPRHNLTIITVPLPRPSSAATDALVAAEFPLFARYQTSQHGDDPANLSPAAFKRFLVDTPLVRDGGGPGDDDDGGGGVGGEPGPAGTRHPSSCGTAHQQYWLDGALIAVGVVDVLPRGLSSVYFFWEPGLGGLGLGRWSALQEIGWTRAEAEARGGAARDGATAAAAAAASTAADAPLPSPCPFRFYYMGYYIHTCPKMRYKAEFAPSELLAVADGEVAGQAGVWPPPPLAWVPAASAVTALDADPRADLRCLLVGGGGGEGAALTTLPSAGPPLAPLPAVLQTLVFSAGHEASGGEGGGGTATPPRPPTRVARLGHLAASGALSRADLAGLVDRLRPWVAAVVAAGVAGEVVVLV